MNNVKVYFQNLSKWTYIRVGGLYLGCSLVFIFGWRILSGGGMLTGFYGIYLCIHKYYAFVFDSTKTLQLV